MRNTLPCYPSQNHRRHKQNIQDSNPTTTKLCLRGTDNDWVIRGKASNIWNGTTDNDLWNGIWKWLRV